VSVAVSASLSARAFSARRSQDTTPLFMVYRLDRSPGAPPPDAPLIDFDQ